MSRKVIETLFQLYGSPAALVGAARKAASLLKQEGPSALLRAAHAKLGRPNLPVHVLRHDPRTHLTFEERWVLRGVGLTRTHSTSIIMLTGGNQQLVTGCLATLSRSMLPDALVDILIINNGGPITLPTAYLFPVRVFSEGRRFNWSAFNNRAAQHAEGEFLLFLNDDIEALHGGWLDAMLAEATQPGVGAVGAKLLYPIGLIQHYGIIVSERGDVTLAHRFLPRDFDRVNNDTVKPHEVMAVTGACLLTTRAVWQTCPFDERLGLSYNDVDYCLRLRAVGKRIVVTPYAELVHRETTTRPLAASLREKRFFTKKWALTAAATPRRPG